jgi:KTSC domain
MERQPVQSRALASVGYDRDEQLLELEFISGTVYQYSGVPATVVDEMLGADSLGTYFNQYVRHSYAYIRL